jgi:hypothetical protein
VPRFAKDQAAADPAGFALVDADREMTWAEVDDSLNRCANRIRQALTVSWENPDELRCSPTTPPKLRWLTSAPSSVEHRLFR